MIFNKHSHFEGCHAFLGASQHAWLNYSPEKLAAVWRSRQAKERGTELHAFAANAIKLKQRLRGSTQTLTRYVNDAISYRMEPEVVLFYSIYCYGTADAISFRNNVLRIHDLKTGEIPASMNQLRIYAAMFCLEYKVHPSDIEIHLAIYQNDNVVTEDPDPEVIVDIMQKIKESDKILTQIQEQEGMDA